MTTPNALPTLPQRHARNLPVAAMPEQESLIRILEQQRAQTLDLVVPRSGLRLDQGRLVVHSTQPQLHDDGVYDVNGRYQLTDNAHNQLAAMFDIPLRYYRRMRDSNVPLLDTSVASWADLDAEGKRVLLRLLWGSQPDDDGTVGLCRAVLSDRYGARDNLPTVIAALAGMREAGLSADNIIGCDVSDDRMYLHVVAPEIAIAAPALLANYTPGGRRDFEVMDDHKGNTHGLRPEDVIQAGLVITNSETGNGKLAVIPRFRVLRCMNGWQITKDAMTKVHLGGKLDEGAIVWSDETRQKADLLVRSQVKDAVQSFLNVEYLEGVVRRIEEEAQTPLSNPVETIEQVSSKLGYTEHEKASVLSAFIKGGQPTSGGVLQAVTYYSQAIDSVDRAHEFEASGIEAMRLANKLEPAIAAKA